MVRDFLCDCLGLIGLMFLAYAGLFAAGLFKDAPHLTPIAVEAPR